MLFIFGIYVNKTWNKFQEDSVYSLLKKNFTKNLDFSACCRVSPLERHRFILMNVSGRRNDKIFTYSLPLVDKICYLRRLHGVLDFRSHSLIINLLSSGFSDEQSLNSGSNTSFIFDVNAVEETPNTVMYNSR